MKLSPRSRPLLVVAHPDDESIFFGGLLRRFRHLDWTVVCVTDGNAEGRGVARHQELLSATRRLGIRRVHHWDFCDNYPHRLDRRALVKRLSQLPRPSVVFTHGVLGEYGHPHHQDVSAAVHECFAADFLPVWSASYNSLGEAQVDLDEKDFTLKLKVLQEVYAKETGRFLNILKCDRTEFYHRVPPAVLSEIYAWIVDETRPLPKKLGPYAVLKPFLQNRLYLKSARGFFNNYFAAPEI